MNRKKLELRPHDPSWADDFAREKTKILIASGDQTITIEHVGSTSIPDIVAKPILDLAIVAGQKGLDAVVAALQELGYDYRGEFEPHEPDHFYAVRDVGDMRFCQAHIYEVESADFRLKVEFRDRLRRDVAFAKEYENYKLELVTLTTDKSEYARIKDDWVAAFIRRNNIGATDGF